MSDTPLTITDLAQTDNETTYDIGDLRRGYNYYGSASLSKLAVMRDPLFRLLAGGPANKPVDDSIFKYVEERPMLHKRYVYVVGYKTWSKGQTVAQTGYTENSADISSLTPQTTQSQMAFKVATDYKSSGNIQNIYGNSSQAVNVAATGTQPIFLIPNLVLKICTKSAYGDLVADDEFTVKILDVEKPSGSEYCYIGVEVVKPLGTSTNYHLCSFTDGTTPISATYAYANGIQDAGTKAPLETMRSYVTGMAMRKGSGIPETYNDSPFSTRFGFTTIHKTSLSMDNTSRATVLKLVANEYARLWRNKLIEHKWGLSEKMYWDYKTTDTDGAQHTDGIGTWALTYANTFSWSTSTTHDTFVSQGMTFLDPRYNAQPGPVVFVCDSMVWEWFHKLGGYTDKNLAIATDAAGYQLQLDKAYTMLGAEIEAFKVAGLNRRVNLIWDPHLDSSHIRMLAVPMDYVKYRPLVGNGLNRDTTILIGVQSEETTGVDAQTDLIRTEFGMEPSMPEAWAVWV